MIDETSCTKERFSWRGAEIVILQIGNNLYKTVIVGTCGQLTNRIAEAKEKGYIGITINEKNNLSRLTNYIIDNKFVLQKASEETGLPKFKIRSLLESYREIGIDFPEVLYPATPKTANIPELFEESAAPYEKNYNGVVHGYKKGRSIERAAIEDLVDIVRSHGMEVTDTKKELADIKKRLELLERKK